MESKIRLKLGPIEVEYEGSESFMKKELPDLIKTVSELCSGGKISLPESDGDKGEQSRLKPQLSTSSIAQKLSCNSGASLVLAAAAHLTLAKEMAEFNRKQLLEEMKGATAYYKNSYYKNLTSQLKGLLKSGKLNEPSKGVFALAAKTREELKLQLVD